MSDSPAQLVVAIDGPSGSGKSSTARGVAERLGLAYLDTGAMYRAATWLALEQGLDRTDQPVIARLIRSTSIEIGTTPEAPTVSVNGRDVTDAIRDPQISAAVSSVATNLDIRADLIDRQRALIRAADRGMVVEGRDITTVVAPQAQVRVLLVADPRARVRRRQAELGDQVNLEDVTDQVIRRDADDSTVTAFHAAAPGVTVVDSTHHTLDEVVEQICELAESQLQLKP